MWTIKHGVVVICLDNHKKWKVIFCLSICQSKDGLFCVSVAVSRKLKWYCVSVKKKKSYWLWGLGVYRIRVSVDSMWTYIVYSLEWEIESKKIILIPRVSQLTQAIIIFVVDVYKKKLGYYTFYSVFYRKKWIYCMLVQ